TSGTTYVGGVGNDTLIGNYYNDTYVFNRGDGADTITDSGSHSFSTSYCDTLVFGEGIGARDLRAQREGNHLLITLADSEGDRITITNWFADGGGNQRIERVNFADGTSWTHADLAWL